MRLILNSVCRACIESVSQPVDCPLAGLDQVTGAHGSLPLGCYEPPWIGWGPQLKISTSTSCPDSTRIFPSASAAFDCAEHHSNSSSTTSYVPSASTVAVPSSPVTSAISSPPSCGIRVKPMPPSYRSQLCGLTTLP